jgi:hypothetical protein
VDLEVIDHGGVIASCRIPAAEAQHMADNWRQLDPARQRDWTFIETIGAWQP